MIIKWFISSNSKRRETPEEIAEDHDETVFTVQPVINDASSEINIRTETPFE